MNEIVTTQPGEESALTVAEPNSLYNFLARAVRDPAIEVHKLEAIYRIITEERREQREIAAEQRRIEFDDAMNLCQAEIQPVARNALNSETRSKYATLEAVDQAIRPIYSKHGFSLSFSEADNDQPEMKIVCIVRRRGHSEMFHLSALSDTTGPKGTPNKTSVQGVGSTVSYLRRYLTCLIFNVALRDDNDGNRVRKTEETGELAGRTQAEELYRLLGECSPNGVADEAAEHRFFDLMRQGDKRLADVTSLKAVPAALFVIVRNALLTKKHNIIQRAALKAKQEMEGVT